MTMIHLDRKAARKLKVRHDIDALARTVGKNADRLRRAAEDAESAAARGSVDAADINLKTAINCARLLRRQVRELGKLRRKVGA
jgi:hypothetical protein